MSDVADYRAANFITLDSPAYNATSPQNFAKGFNSTNRPTSTAPITTQEETSPATPETSVLPNATQSNPLPPATTTFPFDPRKLIDHKLENKMNV